MDHTTSLDGEDSSDINPGEHVTEGTEERATCAAKEGQEGANLTELYERLIHAEARAKAAEGQLQSVSLLKKRIDEFHHLSSLNQSNYSISQLKPPAPLFDQISPTPDGRTDYGKLRAAVDALQAILEKENLDLIPPDWKATILQASSSIERDRFRNFLAKEVTWASTLDYICNRFQPAKSRVAAKVTALKQSPTAGESISLYVARYISMIQPLWQDDLHDSGVITLILHSLIENCTIPFMLTDQQAEILCIRADNLSLQSTNLDPLFTFQADLEKAVGSRVAVVVPVKPVPRLMLSEVRKLKDPCLYFQNGRCKFGDACQRQHIPLPGNRLNMPNPGCLDFANGHCYRGDSCRFIHRVTPKH